MEINLQLTLHVRLVPVVFGQVDMLAVAVPHLGEEEAALVVVDGGSLGQELE